MFHLRKHVLSYLFGILVLLLHFSMPAKVCATSAEEVLVVVNKQMWGARDIADYYMKMRKIPKENLLVTSLTTKEVMSREEYEKELLVPVRNAISALKQSGTSIYAIVLIYGVPLKVDPPALQAEVVEQVFRLEQEKKMAQRDKARDEGAAQLVRQLAQKISELTGRNQRAAVDSELMLAKAEGYKLNGWIENPYYLGFQGKKDLLAKDDVLVVARLDGPDRKTVYRIIDDTLAAEKNGLKGKGYFDTRWPYSADTTLHGYRQWDASLHRAAVLVRRRMPVEIDDRDELFAPGDAPDAALYCGWYSRAKYIDSFTWVQGAIGFHIASSECKTLKKADSQIWCVQMLKHGVAATIGPVYEPYVQGFPYPELFFGALTDGHMDLGESYLISLPYISWQVVLVGDPLYRPFRPLPGAGGVVPMSQ